MEMGKDIYGPSCLSYGRREQRAELALAVGGWE